MSRFCIGNTVISNRTGRVYTVLKVNHRQSGFSYHAKWINDYSHRTYILRSEWLEPYPTKQFKYKLETNLYA